MKKLWISLALAGVLFLTFAGYSTRADDDETLLRAKLSGFQEVPPKVTNGTGTFRATINGNSISYELTFSDLSTKAFGAHIHFAQRGVNGGIFAFLCGGGGQAPCPPAGGTVTGTITAANILGPTPDQGITAGDFAAAVRAIRSGETYANVHSMRYPGGEIRGQIKVEDEVENH
jgi:hypothetical protein